MKPYSVYSALLWDLFKSSALCWEQGVIWDGGSVSLAAAGTSQTPSDVFSNYLFKCFDQPVRGQPTAEGF